MNPMGPNAPQFHHPPPQPKSSGGAVAVIGIILAVVAIVVVGVSILAVLAVYGVRRYIANAKIAEARNNVAAIGRAAVAAYEREKIGSTTSERRLCGSSSSVPKSTQAIRGTKYQSAESDWDGTTETGWTCLKFSLYAPQYFQYRYEATPTTFTVTAHGDLNGDGVLSTFTLTGTVTNGQVVVSPVIKETDPEE